MVENWRVANPRASSSQRARWRPSMPAVGVGARRGRWYPSTGQMREIGRDSERPGQRSSSVPGPQPDRLPGAMPATGLDAPGVPA